MENYFESTLEDVLRWELIDQLGDLDDPFDDAVIHGPPKPVYSLQRDYVSLYGSHPKMENRIYSTCGICEQVFNPQAITSHKEHCPGKGKIQLQQLKKKVKNKKKLQAAAVPLPPLFKKESPGPPVLSKFSDVSPPQAHRSAPEMLPLPDPIISRPLTPKLPPEMVESLPSTSVASPPTPPPPPLPPSPLLIDVAPPLEEPPPIVSGRHKKSKSKKNKVYSPDGGNCEGQKGPCTRSIVCSNHKGQLRKSLGRSKKSTKEKDCRQHSPPCLLEMEPEPQSEYMFSLVEPEPINCDVPENSDEVLDFAPATPKLPPSIALAQLPENELHDEVESDDPSNHLESGYCSVETSLSTKSSPVLYFNPISPIFVVTPIQFIQKENTMFVEAPAPVHSPPPNGYFLTMPEPSSNIKLYKSHPKPTILPSYGARKVGGAILGSNQRLEYQRKDIQKAITSRRLATASGNCKATSYTVPPQRSILLKAKGISKVSCKRSSTDKLSVSDSKQIKLAADVNGFILHTDMSEVAEAPQSNYCIQENINLLNMK